jgi:hypothetical protein
VRLQLEEHLAFVVRLAALAVSKQLLQRARHLGEPGGSRRRRGWAQTAAWVGADGGVQQ